MGCRDEEKPRAKQRPRQRGQLDAPFLAAGAVRAEGGKKAGGGSR